jgi:hypothetical protein
MIYGNKKLSVSRLKTGGMLRGLEQAGDDPVFHHPDERFGGQKFFELLTTLAWEIPSIMMSDCFWYAINDFGDPYYKIITKEISVEEGLKRAQEAVLKRME